jgi:hypothetical protein
MKVIFKSEPPVSAIQALESSVFLGLDNGGTTLLNKSTEKVIRTEEAKK